MEKWEPLKGFEGLYEISTFGRIRSLRNTPRMLKQYENSKGYFRVCLTGNSKQSKFYFVHRLVAEQFIEHDNELNTVNHLDFNPHNNCVENLEWTTQLENMRYSIKNGRFDRTDSWLSNLRKSNEEKGSAVVGIPLDGGAKLFFTCLNDTRVKGFQPSCVCNCCKGKRKTHKGYSWRYATVDEKQQWGCG